VQDRTETLSDTIRTILKAFSRLSCTCMCTVFPLLYQYVNLSDTQFGNVLDFCEYTAESVLYDTSELLDNHSRLPHQDRNQTVCIQLECVCDWFLEIWASNKIGALQVDLSCLVDFMFFSCEAPVGAVGLSGRRGQKVWIFWMLLTDWHCRGRKEDTVLR
jgi:hypothetical protein